MSYPVVALTIMCILGAYVPRRSKIQNTSIIPIHRTCQFKQSCPQSTVVTWASRALRCGIPQAPRCQSFTSRYLHCAVQPSKSHCRDCTGDELTIFCGAESFAGSAASGTEKVNTSRGPSEPSLTLLPAGTSTTGRLMVEIQRYIVGGVGVWLLLSSKPSPISTSCPFAPAESGA